MNYYALILLAYYLIYFGVNLVNAGKPRYVTPLHLILSQIFSYTLLILGGFFAVWNWPQIVILGSACLTWGMFLGNDFKPVESTFGPFKYIFVSIIAWTILYCGGFWPILPAV